MPCGTFVTSGLSETKAKTTKALFEANQPPPKSVTSEKQADGTFTVTAVFPPCPEGTTHSSGDG